VIAHELNNSLAPISSLVHSGRLLAREPESQVMINLLKNAAESGSPADTIAVSVREQSEGFTVEVADRGSGLAENVLRDALLPFYSTKATGTGLGLNLCREIVEAHCGRLSIANRAGGGALATLWLP
jgi:two-component system nitrogen regulation sensor histidine kinase NtrY